jgi:basic membrane lipoprotein Med (substrate-binding protein (PBP1-ABC) superfamily)
MFQVAGKTGNGILQAACAAKIVGIGVDVDQYVSLSAATDSTYGCILTSAEKHLATSVENAIDQISGGTAKGGNVLYNAANGGIGVADYTSSVTVPDAVKADVTKALAAMVAGTLTTCPSNCGSATP